MSGPKNVSSPGGNVEEVAIEQNEWSNSLPVDPEKGAREQLIWELHSILDPMYD